MNSNLLPPKGIEREKDHSSMTINLVNTHTYLSKAGGRADRRTITIIDLVHCTTQRRGFPVNLHAHTHTDTNKTHTHVQKKTKTNRQTYFATQTQTYFATQTQTHTHTYRL